ncbi:MAG: phosphoribosylformylglycinamidine synthase subunit PurQ [Spirochaetales bacterium]|nr:phosphoribosylformylglycinamidine synthase subunit PurQ [Spirochaetales bacterium]
MTVKACILTGYGINADIELTTAFKMAGAEAQRVHINDLIENPALLDEFHIAGFAGGFSFGDHLGSGLVYSHLFKKNLKAQLDKFVADGKIIIGICNGFQVLVKMGVLPNTKGDWTQEVSLIHNDSGLFQDQWVKVKYNQNSNCIWTQGLAEADLPIRHGEGKFITDNDEIKSYIVENNLGAIVYDGNPNGSELDIAGITDTTGRILGLMPHPEAFIYPQNHPKWHRTKSDKIDGIKLFENGVNYIKANFK